MKLGISSSKSSRRSFSTLCRAANIALFQELEQRRLLSVTPLGPIPSETASSNPSAVYVVNGVSLFFADDTTGQQHLYKTDGTAAGTQLVSTQSLDNSTSGGADVAVAGNNLFYITDTGDGQQIEEATVGSDGSVTMNQFTSIAPDSHLDRYDIEGVAGVGSNVYFWTDDNTNASGDTTPYSLWVSNGTTAGTINLGSFSEVNEVSGINGKAVFAANDGTHGEELWVSDGTVTGTTPLQQSGGGDISNPEDFVADGTNLFFGNGDGGLFYTDGTEAGTNQVNGPDYVEVDGTSTQNTDEHLSVLSGDVYYASNDYLYKTSADGSTTTKVGDNAYGVYETTPVGSNIFFEAQDGTHGYELWKSDGTTITMVSDINPGSEGSNPFNLTASGNELFFEAEPTGDTDQIFATDGTTVTQLTNTLNDAGDFENGISSGGNGIAYTSYNDGFHGTELLKLTSTTASLLADVNTAPSDNSQAPQDITQVGNELYFVSGSDNNETLWKTDGTAAGTIEIGPSPTILNGTQTSPISIATGMTVSNLIGGTSVLYFQTNADGTGNSLWMYNGTTATKIQYVSDSTTTPATDSNIVPTDGNMLTVGNTLYFDFNGTVNGVNDGDELWKTDGTTAGTMMVKNIDTISTGSGNDADSTPQNFEALGSKLLFTANDGSGVGAELWVSDGTASGTVAIKHLLPGTSSSININNYAVVNSVAYFTVDDNGNADLWKSDGTAAGTVKLATFSSVDLGDYGTNGDTAVAPVIGGDFFFEATSFDNMGQSLWKTDGTAAGTVLVKSENFGEGGSGGLDPSDLVNLNSSTIMFSGDSGAGQELWKTDGTTAGTVQVADIDTGQEGSDPAYLVVANGELYFSAVSGDTDPGDNDRELWKSDGTTAGTQQVKQLYPATGLTYSGDGADVSDLTAVGSKVFFTADDSVHGTELWETDGTSAGTFLVQDINPNGSSDPDNLSALGNNTLAFFADNGTNGDQPYSAAVPSYSLNVSTTTLNVPENGSNSFTVDLSSAPTANVTVTVSEESGGSSTLTAAPTTLTFTPTNWDDAQTVTLSGAQSSTSLNSTGIFDVSTDNLQQSITATETAPAYGLVVSNPTLSVPENGTGTFTVALSAAPAANVTVTVAKASGGSSDLTTSATTLTFTPADWNTPQTVTVSGAVEDAALNGTATFDVSAQDVATQTVSATETAATSGIVVLSATTINVQEGGSATFGVHLSSAPVGNYTVTISFASGDSILSTSPSPLTLTFNASNYNVDQNVTISSGTDSDTLDQTADFAVSSSGFPNQTVTATQIDTSGPKVGTFTVSPTSGTSKSTIKLVASGVTGDNGTGTAASVRFYFDTNSNGVYDSGDALLKTVKVKKGGASYSLKVPKTLTTGAHDFFAVAVDSSGLAGQAASGTFTLNAVTAKVKKASLRAASLAATNSPASSDLSSSGITQSMFSQTPILG